MLSTGNGKTQVCASNLMQIVRGEVPYERLKGVDATIIDRPSATVKATAMADALWLLKTYEPRIVASETTIKQLAGQTGDFSINTNLITEGGI